MRFVLLISILTYTELLADDITFTELKCDALLNSRDRKLRIQQRMLELIDQSKRTLNESLQAEVDSEADSSLKTNTLTRPSARAKLRSTLSHLEREEKLLRMDLTVMKENLIRRGCPTIRFE